MKRNSQEGRCAGPRRAPCARMQQLESGDGPQRQVIVGRWNAARKAGLNCGLSSHLPLLLSRVML